VFFRQPVFFAGVAAKTVDSNFGSSAQTPISPESGKERVAEATISGGFLLHFVPLFKSAIDM